MSPSVLDLSLALLTLGYDVLKFIFSYFLFAITIGAQQIQYDFEDGYISDLFAWSGSPLSIVNPADLGAPATFGNSLFVPTTLVWDGLMHMAEQPPNWTTGGSFEILVLPPKDPRIVAQAISLQARKFTFPFNEWHHVEVETIQTRAIYLRSDGYDANGDGVSSMSFLVGSMAIAVPEPTTWQLMLIGTAPFLLVLRRQRGRMRPAR